MNRRARTIAAVAALAIAVGIGIGATVGGPAALAQDPDTGRWYSQAHVDRGAVLFAANCAVCHGDKAQGTFNWRKRDANGNLPPPPLDGSAHTWHHPIQVLGRQVKHGTPKGMGTMPGFGEVIGDDGVADVLAWIQSLWPDRVYAEWFEIQKRAGGG